jgi:transposase
MLDGCRYVKVRGTVAPDQPRRPCRRLVQRQARWVARANQLIQAFLAIARERRGHDLEPWMAEATHSGIDERARAARGLQEDRAAVTAGLTLARSNDVTAGRIHRLKLVKRQG